MTPPPLIVEVLLGLLAKKVPVHYRDNGDIASARVTQGPAGRGVHLAVHCKARAFGPVALYRTFDELEQFTLVREGEGYCLVPT